MTSYLVQTEICGYNTKQKQPQRYEKKMYLISPTQQCYHFVHSFAQYCIDKYTKHRAFFHAISCHAGLENYYKIYCAEVYV